LPPSPTRCCSVVFWWSSKLLVCVPHPSDLSPVCSAFCPPVLRGFSKVISVVKKKLLFLAVANLVPHVHTYPEKGATLFGRPLYAHPPSFFSFRSGLWLYFCVPGEKLHSLLKASLPPHLSVSSFFLLFVGLAFPRLWSSPF